MFEEKPIDRVLHVLVVASSGVLVVGGDVDLGAGADGEVLVADGVAGSDLRSFLDACQCSSSVTITRFQPTVSRAMATGRPAWVLSASRALSMTDWWYSYEPWEKFMRTTLRPALLVLAWVLEAEQK